MNRLPFASALLALALSACHSASPPPPSAVTPPLLAARLAPSWISAATRVQNRDRFIYYQGTAQPAPRAHSPAWSGTVSGDVLAIDAQSAILVTGGSLTIAPGGRGQRGRAESGDLVRHAGLEVPARAVIARCQPRLPSTKSFR